MTKAAERIEKQDSGIEFALDELPQMAVYCPIPPAIHPAAAGIEAGSLVWLERHAFFGADRGQLIDTNSGEFAARVAPTGIAERLQIAADWDYWGFVIDDRSDQGYSSGDVASFVRYAHHVIRVLETHAPVTADMDCLAAGLVDISRRFAECVTEQQHRRWVQAHRAWLFGVAAQIAVVDPDLDEYLAIRLSNAAGEVVTVTAELVCGYEIPPAEYHSPLVRSLTEMCRLLAALDNDLHSYRKTIACGEQNQQNIVRVIAEHRRCSVPAAIAEAIRLRDRIMCRFLASSKTCQWMSADTRSYVRNLGQVIRGNIDWALSVPRYRVAGRTVADTFSIADRPSESASQAPGLPAIDWWWDV